MNLSEPVWTLPEAIGTYLNLSEPIWTYLNLPTHIRTYPNLSEHNQTYHLLFQLYPNISEHIHTYQYVYSLLFLLFFTLQIRRFIMLDLSKYLTICDHLKISRTAFYFIKLIYCLFLPNNFVQTLCLCCLPKEGTKLYKFFRVLFKMPIILLIFWLPIT